MLACACPFGTLVGLKIVEVEGKVHLDTSATEVMPEGRYGGAVIVLLILATIPGNLFWTIGKSATCWVNTSRPLCVAGIAFLDIFFAAGFYYMADALAVEDPQKRIPAAARALRESSSLPCFWPA